MSCVATAWVDRVMVRPSRSVSRLARANARLSRDSSFLVQAVKRNAERFPSDFMFQLSDEEFANLKSQIVTSSWGGQRRASPYAFTEQGVAMLSTVLRSRRAVLVNIEIMRTFVRLRQLMAGNSDLARKLAELEKKYDRQFKVVFDAIRALMRPPVKAAVGRLARLR